MYSCKVLVCIEALYWAITFGQLPFFRNGLPVFANEAYLSQDYFGRLPVVRRIAAENAKKGCQDTCPSIHSTIRLIEHIQVTRRHFRTLLI